MTFIKAFKYYIFDLDSTLYEENIYLFNGYFNISKFLEMKIKKHSVIEYYRYLTDEFLRNGRSNIFDKLIIKFDLDINLLPKFLNILRTQKISPKVPLYKDIEHLISDLILNNKKIFIVTNGNIQQQENKISNINWKNYLSSIEILFANKFSPKPNSASFNYILENTSDYDLTQYIMIGDSIIDKSYAHNCNIAFKAVNDIFMKTEK